MDVYCSNLSMPIYAFRCVACGHAFDKLQKMSDPDPAACPQCGAEAVQRQVTAPSFRLSGSGWYETDFKKDGDRKRNLTGDGGKSAEAGKSESPTPKVDDKKAADKPAAAKTESKPKPAAKAD